MMDGELPLFILYGSATGNAQQIAQDLEAKYKSNIPHPFTSIVCCPANDFKRKCSPKWEVKPSSSSHNNCNYGLIVISSTTGNGDAPENASRFMRYVKRKDTAESKAFQYVNFAVLGLGDSNYDQFCAAGKTIDKKLEECGGSRVKPLACADEATGLEDVVEDWVDDVVQTVAKSCDSNVGTSLINGSDDANRITKTGESMNECVDNLKINMNIVQEEKKVDEEINTTTSRNMTTTPTAAQATFYGSRPNIAAIMSARTKNNSESNQTLASHAYPGSRPVIPTRNIAPLPPAKTVIPNGSILDKQATIITPTNIQSTKNTLSSQSQKPPLCILYGSATGNAEHIAKDLCEKYNNAIHTKKNKFSKAICCELNQYKKQCQSLWEDDTYLSHNNNGDMIKHGVLIITSTTGNGDSPENASRFVRYVKNKTTIPTQPFRNVSYAVLGLGDTNYDKFCENAKVIDRKLEELGGVRACDLICADEATGLEECVDPWVETIFTKIHDSCFMDDRNDGHTIVVDKQTGHNDRSSHEESDIVDDTKINVVDDSLSKKHSSVDKIENEGVSKVRRLIASISSVSDSTIPTVPQNLLPTLKSSRSSCNFVVEDELNARRSSRGLSLSDFDRMTVSTSSSSALHYTIYNPYESTILGARYLTRTNIEGAEAASKALDISNNDFKDVNTKVTEATRRLREAFPLYSDGSTQTDNCDHERNGKRVIELTLSLPDDFTLEYKPGDSIGIIVSNTPKAVNFVLDFLHKNHGIKPSQKISVDSGNPVTVEEVINDYIDLCSPIKNKRILSSLSQYATDKNEEKILRLLASKLPLGERLFQSFIHDQRTSVVDILECFPSCQNITLEGLLAVIPGIAPRYYSISSSPLARKKGDDLSFNIAFSVVDYIVPSLFTDNDNNNSNDRRRVGGLATQYLEAICSPFLCRRATLGSSFSYSIPTVKIFPKPTAEFHLPPSLDTPLILVGPGTGVAPFMGFLHHRQAQIMSGDITEAAKTVSEGTWRGGYDIEEEDLSISKSDAKGLVIGADYRNLQEVGEVYLYFGCRYSDHDWLYKDEMTTFEKEKTVNTLQVAFSRENGDGNKIYVQDKIKGDAKQLTQMIVRKNAMIYICGDGNHMAKAVQSAFVSILAKENFSSEGTGEHALAQANTYLEQMKVNKRFVMDIWS